MSRRRRARARLHLRFSWFLRRWLATLPAGGWAGTSRELWRAMDSKRRWLDVIPAPNALLACLRELVGRVAECGFGVRHRRTARARLVIVESLPAVSDGSKIPA